MAKYLVRIELHHASTDDYEELHAQMANRGFSREITSGDGRTYELPTAEYVIRTDSNLQAVRRSAAAAAEATGRKFGVVVAEYTKSAWSGLAFA